MNRTFSLWFCGLTFATMLISSGIGAFRQVVWQDLTWDHILMPTFFSCYAALLIYGFILLVISLVNRFKS